jgi:hypothetical protein
VVCAKPRGLQQASISKGIQASKFLWSKKTLKTLGIIGSVVWLSAQYLDQTVSFLVFWFTSKKIRAKYDQQGQGEASFAPISFEVQPNDELVRQQILNFKPKYIIGEQKKVCTLVDFQAQGYKTWVDFFLEVNLSDRFIFRNGVR